MHQGWKEVLAGGDLRIFQKDANFTDHRLLPIKLIAVRDIRLAMKQSSELTVSAARLKIKINEDN